MHVKSYLNRHRRRELGDKVSKTPTSVVNSNAFNSLLPIAHGIFAMIVALSVLFSDDE